jgi:hypothetical protein
MTEYCGRCREGEGWICEQHPNKPFPHNDCNGPGMPCVNGCNALAPDPKKPYCCLPGCPADADFSIHGSPGQFEDVTEACESHVGALLSAHDHWLVYPIECSIRREG